MEEKKEVLASEGQEPKGLQLDEGVEEVQTVKALTVRELKAKLKPQFQKDYEKYYPIETFKKIGFQRDQCKLCEKFFWSKSPKTNCGDSICRGSYGFIGNGVGLGAKGKKLTFAEAYKTFEKSFTQAEVPCTAIPRYPVVARWRNDVDYVAAGIYCFQPYCVTGEMQPPANPLICPQFCVRFNDLDNIGLTGRHYSGFVMLGIQTFNYPGDFKFFKDECVEYNYNWLTKELEIDPEEITFTEDLWAGGGNMGPSIEYFVRGMELGNMVFMQFKTFHDGSFEELKIKVIDTGIGLERIAWVVNGEATSYMTVFKNALEFLLKKLELEVDHEVWAKFGPYSSQLDVDENPDLDKTWQQISDIIKIEKDAIKKAIEPLRDVFIILDHTRSAFFLIYDGSLPSNVGGGSNLRNIIRRSFAILKKQNWWEKLGLDGYLELFNYHKKDLEDLYGKFKDYSSFDDIIRLEHKRWEVTDEVQRQKLNKLLQAEKNLSLEHWSIAMTSWGIPADTISSILKLPIPDRLYQYIAEKQERIVKAPDQILYETSHLPETTNLYFEHHQDQNVHADLGHFEAKVLEVFENMLDRGKMNIVIFDQSGFYPTSGGQSHDIGKIILGGVEYQVINVEKVGRCVLHTLDRGIEGWEGLIGQKVEGWIDMDRRVQLRNHHTAAHIIFASCRKVLGPHVWQNGAKKTPEQAHLDITHFASLTDEQETAIEQAANQIVLESHQIVKGVQLKSDAEKNFGFSLYQGGMVPGNQLRVVNITGVDVEACCGTHCDNTSEVGVIKVLTTKRIADGIVRLYFVAGNRSLEVLKQEKELLLGLQNLWGVSQNMILPTAQRFFVQNKKVVKELDDATKKIMLLELQILTTNPKINKLIINSNESDPTIYFSHIGNFAEEIKREKKSIVYIGKTFIFGLFGDDDKALAEEIQKFLEIPVRQINQLKVKGKAVKDVLVLSAVSQTKIKSPLKFFEEKGFSALK